MQNIGIKSGHVEMKRRYEIIKQRDDSLCMSAASSTPAPPGGLKCLPAPPSVHKVVGASTLTTRTSTLTDITQSTRGVADFRQFRLNDHCTVMGCPDLPMELVFSKHRLQRYPVTI